MEMGVLWGSIGGIIYGVMMAIYFRVSRYFLGLPGWDQFRPDWEEVEEDW